MLESQKIDLRRSKIRERLAAIAKLEGDAYSDEIRSEETALQDEYTGLEVRHRSAVIAEDAESRAAEDDAALGGATPEIRERVELRGKARLGNYLQTLGRGRPVNGVEAEFNDAVGIPGNAIPLELWEPTPEQRMAEYRAMSEEQRAVTPAPTTVGVNLDTIQPAVFASSIAPRLGIDMPRVDSGTYATATITTNQSASALAKGTAAVGAAGALTVQTTTPHRVSARLELAIEDIAAVGQANFESVLRQNLALALSDALDNFAINGTGAGANPGGLLNALTNPTAGTTVADFDAFLAAFTGGIDGLWASELSEVAILCGVDTYRLSAATWRDKLYGAASVSVNNARAATTSAETFAQWARMHTGGWWTSSRMPDAASDNQAAILYRRGRAMMGASMGMRTAVMPTWGAITIDDLYSGSASGERYLTMHVLVGDCRIVQSGVYSEQTFHLA